MNSLVSPLVTTNRCTSEGLRAQDLGRQLAFTRREFLRAAAGLSFGSGLMASSLLPYTGIPAKRRKVVVVTFGGGPPLMPGSSRRATAFTASEKAAIATMGPAWGLALFFPSAS